MIEYAEKNNNMAQAQWLHSQLLESLMNDPVGTTNVAMPVTRDAPQQQETAMVKESSARPLDSILCNISNLGTAELPARIDRDESSLSNHVESEEPSAAEEATATTTVSIKEEPPEGGEVAKVDVPKAMDTEVAPTRTEIVVASVQNETLPAEDASDNHVGALAEVADQNLTQTLSLCQPIPQKRQASGSLKIVRATKKLKLDSRDESNVDGKTKKFV
jgi:hypothetical protein